jgi:hypothetical protein
MMEKLLERSFVMPGVNMPVGLDALIGLVPVLGDIVTTALGAYIVWEARNLGLPKWKLADGRERAVRYRDRRNPAWWAMRPTSCSVRTRRTSRSSSGISTSTIPEARVIEG